MQSNDAILVALIVALVLVIAYQGCGWVKGQNSGDDCEGFAGKHGAACEGSAGKHGGGREGFAAGPCAARRKRLDTIRGYRNDGFNQPPIWQLPGGLEAYGRSAAQIKPEQLAEAEREQWFSAAEDAGAAGFNPELSQEAHTDTMQYHSAQPVIDYDSYITDLVVDPRTRSNHQRWAEEMKPWSGTAKTVDNIDEAMEASSDWIGLRRPQPVAQCGNSLQLTERDTSTYASNSKFNFKG
jgi:hypothetical protein